MTLDPQSVELASRPLEYRAATPTDRNRRWAKFVAWAGVFVGVALSAPWMKDRAVNYWRLMQIRSAERDCLAHPIPQGTLVYSSSSPTTAMSPSVTRLLRSLQRPSAGLVLYAGRRQATGKPPRFIAILAQAARIAGKSWFVTVYALLPPEGIGDRLRSYSVSGIGGAWAARQPPPRPAVELYSAVEDPADTSHLTIKFNVFNESVTDECWLRGDGSVRTTEVRTQRKPGGEKGKSLPEFFSVH